MQSFSSFSVDIAVCVIFTIEVIRASNQGCRLSNPTSGIRALVREGFWLLGRPIEGFFGVHFSGRSRRFYPIWATRLSTTKVAAGSRQIRVLGSSIVRVCDKV